MTAPSMAEVLAEAILLALQDAADLTDNLRSSPDSDWLPPRYEPTFGPLRIVGGAS